MGKKFFVFIIACFIFCTAAYADHPGPEQYPEPTHTPCSKQVIQTPCQPQYIADTPRLFALGRSVGASYFHLIDLSDKVAGKPFLELQHEYSTVFQNINIIDIILEDLDIYDESRHHLNKLRIDFYNALRNQDLSETQVAFVRDMFVIFYENLAQSITARYGVPGNWLLSLGFYSSFQLESLNAPAKEKILLSGFRKIFDARPVAVPENIYTSLVIVNNLDKSPITQTELAMLGTNLVNITEYFSNYPQTRPLIAEIKDLVGVWQGILINPENEKHDIRLTINKDRTAVMDISGIAGEILISDIKIVNNYFTFMFKPFGTEKLHMRFDAKLSENIFAGEITDVLGAKGYWVLAKTDKNRKLGDKSLDTMVSYVAWVQNRLMKLPVIEIKDLQLDESKIFEEIKEISLPPELEEIDETYNEASTDSWWQRFKNRLKTLFRIK